MGRIIAAIIRAINATTQTVLDSILNLSGRVIATGFAAFGFGVGSDRPAQDPVFDVPVDTKDLVAPPRGATIRDLDRDGIRTVYQYAKASEKDRATFDLSPVRRADVQALLLRMTQDQLTTLSLAESGAVRRFVLTGNAGVSGVPSVPVAKAIELEEQEINAQLAAHLRALKERMAKPSGGSRPYTMPKL